MLRLKKPWRRRIKALKSVFSGNMSVYMMNRKTWHNAIFVGSHLAALTGVHTVMEARCDVPTHLAQKHHTSGFYERSIYIIRERNTVRKYGKGNIEENRKEGSECVLTGERASETTRSFSHCGMAVGCRRYCHLGNGSIVYFGKLEDQFRGRSPSPPFPSLLQGSNLVKGATLWGWRLRMGGGRLGLVSTWGAARTRAGTAGRASVQDNTTWRNREGRKLSELIFIWVMFSCTMWCSSVEQCSTLIQTHTKARSCLDNRNLIWWII